MEKNDFILELKDELLGYLNTEAVRVLGKGGYYQIKEKIIFPENHVFTQEKDFTGLYFRKDLCSIITHEWGDLAKKVKEFSDERDVLLKNGGSTIVGFDEGRYFALVSVGKGFRDYIDIHFNKAMDFQSALEKQFT